MPIEAREGQMYSIYRNNHLFVIVERGTIDHTTPSVVVYNKAVWVSKHYTPARIVRWLYNMKEKFNG
jgi:hypothetical protein